MPNIKKIHYLINSVVICLLIINIANASESFKLKDCEGKNILESENSVISFKVNNINGNKDIIIHSKSGYLEPRLLTESHAIFKSVKSGNWTLCIPGLTYSSVEVLEADLVNSKNVNSKNYIIAGVAAAAGGYLIGYSLDDSSNTKSVVSEQNTEEASSGTSTSSATDTSSSSTAGSTSQNDPKENEALLPDDSCSKTSTRSSSIRNRGCGGSPESLPDTAFN